MVKVYIVTSGEYSDYSIEAVFSQKADAEAFLLLNIGDWRDSTEVEEWELDPELTDIREGKPRWFVRMTPQGECAEVYRWTHVPDDVGPDIHGNYYWSVRAKDEQGAIKVAHDKWSGWRIAQDK